MDGISTQELITINSEKLYKISELEQEIEILKKDIYRNNQLLRQICEHEWNREIGCGPCDPTRYICVKCGLFR